MTTATPTRDPLQRFMAQLAGIHAMRTDTAPNYVLYGHLKAQLTRDFPGIEPAQFDRAVMEIARACNV